MPSMHRSRPRTLLFLFLALSLAVTSGCDSGGTNGGTSEPGPVSIASISVGPDGVTTVSWTEYDADNFGAYVVYRSAPGTSGFQQLKTISSKQKTRLRNRPLGFVGGTLRYRVDVRTTDETTFRGETAQHQTPVPNASAEVTRDSTVSVSWSKCPFPDAFVGYVVQRRPSSSPLVGTFENVAVIEEISDTTTTVKTAFGRVDDYRVVTSSQIVERSVAGNLAGRVGMGASFPPHVQTRYAPSRDELYVTNEEPPYVLRLGAESLSRKDSASISLSLSRRASHAVRAEMGTSSLEQIDPVSFDVTKTFSVSSLPQFDPDNTPAKGVQVLETGRLLYTAYSGNTQEELKVYDFQNETLVGQTEEGVPASALSASYSGNYAVVKTDERAIYDVGGDEVRRIGVVPESNPSHFHWIETPNAGDRFATYDSGEITIRQAHDLSRVRQFTVDFSLTHLGYDPGTGTLWGTDEAVNQLYVFSVDSGTVLVSLPLADQTSQHYDVTKGRVFYDEGRVFDLNLLLL